MKITKTRLKQLIKEELLREMASRDKMDRMINNAAEAASEYHSDYEYSEIQSEEELLEWLDEEFSRNKRMKQKVAKMIIGGANEDDVREFLEKTLR